MEIEVYDMKIGEIVKDSLRYPFSDWKKILILGIILLIYSSHIVTYLVLLIFFMFLNVSNLSNVLSNNIIIPIVSGLYDVIGVLFLFFIFGYLFKIIKSSLNGSAELPILDDFIEIFKDGVKVYLVFIVYSIPVILFSLIFAGSLRFVTDPTPITIFIAYFDGIGDVFGAMLGIYLLIILYSIIIFPISYLALANMANKNRALREAFRLKEIFNRISTLGLKNLTVFYLITIIPVYITVYIITIFGIGIIYGIVVLIVAPYLKMYLYRLVALLYMSKEC